jgi:hypothetical protein
MFLDGSLINKICMLTCYGGSLIGFLAGMLAAEKLIDPVPGVQIAIIAVITAMTGLFGGVAIPAFKLWLEYREKARNDLRQVVDKLQRHVDETARQVDVVLANQQEHLKHHPPPPPPAEEDLG